MANYGELSLLEQARAPSGGSQGASMLGFALGGGGRQQTEEAYNRGALSSANLYRVLADARRVRDASLHRQAIMHELESRGDSRSLMLAHMIGTMNEVNPNLVADYDSKEQEAGFKKQAWDNANAQTHDDNLMNRQLAVIDGKPVTLTKIEDNTVLNPQVTPDLQRLQTTDLGRAIIAAHGAQATDSYAAAGQHNAEAKLARARTDEVNGNISTGKAEGKPLTREEVLATFGKPDKYGTLQASPEDYLPFLKFQEDQSKTDPRFRNAHFAAMAWAKRALGPQQALAATGTTADDAAAEPELSLPAMAAAASAPAAPVAARPVAVSAPSPSILAMAQSPTANGDPADSPDITYDPQNRGLPFTTNNVEDAKALAATRDAAIRGRVVRTGKAKDGTPVVQYEDGTIAPAGQ